MGWPRGRGKRGGKGMGGRMRPIPSQSRKNVRREVAADDVAMDSQFRKKKLIKKKKKAV